MKDDPRDEEELRKLLLEVSSEGATAETPGGQERADEWLATARAYDELGAGLEAEEREIVARAMAETPDPADRAAVRELLVLASLEKPTPVRSRHRLVWGLVALLAILIGASFWMLQVVEERIGEPGTVEPLFLGATNELELLAPVGTVAAWEDFRWSAVELPPGGRYRLVVSADRAELFRVEGLRGNTYTPSLPERRLLAKNEALGWEVEAYSADGERIAWGSVEAALRSR